MTYSYETSKYTIYLIALIVVFTFALFFLARGIVGVLWPKHGEPVKSSLFFAGATIVTLLTLFVSNIFSVNSFDVKEFQEMLQPTGYLVGRDLPTSYNSPIPVETVDGNKCFFVGGIKAMLPNQVFVFTPKGCEDIN